MNNNVTERVSKETGYDVKVIEEVIKYYIKKAYTLLKEVNAEPEKNYDFVFRIKYLGSFVCYNRKPHLKK